MEEISAKVHQAYRALLAGLMSLYGWTNQNNHNHLVLSPISFCCPLIHVFKGFELISKSFFIEPHLWKIVSSKIGVKSELSLLNCFGKLFRATWPSNRMKLFQLREANIFCNNWQFMNNGKSRHNMLSVSKWFSCTRWEITKVYVKKDRELSPEPCKCQLFSRKQETVTQQGLSAKIEKSDQQNIDIKRASHSVLRKVRKWKAANLRKKPLSIETVQLHTDSMR